MPRYIGAYRGGVRPSAPTTVYRTCALALPCHSEPVTDVTGVGIRPPPFSCLRRGTFALGGKSTQKRRSNLRFENPLCAFTCFLSCQNKPRERCAVEISPKYCIVSASLFAAAFALKYRSNRFYRGRDQRQRRRRRDDPFVRTISSNPRDRAVQTNDTHAA